jgi:radical SAM superfamily enzyme YgiQ (UPF0313 family)
LQSFQNKETFEKIAGITFLQDGEMFSTPALAPDAKQNTFLENLPFPDFGLIRDCKIKEYPIGRIRGCSMNCEFCSVKGKPCWFSAEKLFEIVKMVSGNQKSQKFFSGG